MNQLVELKKSADAFKSLNAEVLVVFREESEGVDGLKKIKRQHDPPYLLTFDKDAKQTRDYSSKRMTFDNYVIDSKGIVRGIVDGTLRDRAKSDQLLQLLRKIESD
ncbi:MAG: redoxin domain-containing protein [Rubripirellula sp.]|nr:redoxin domain-containing protein [Rubripirellula sp.]